MKRGIHHSDLDYSKADGQSYRVRECKQCAGLGNTMAVQITRRADGFLWYCFRCRISGFVSDTKASPQQVQQVLQNGARPKKEDTRPLVVYLPDDYTVTIPPKALVQLYDLSLTDEDIERHEIGWSPSKTRIIVPVYKYGQGPGGWAKKLVGVMGRKLESDTTDKPKWWSIRQRDIKHPRFTAIPETIVHSKQVVFVEDIFSAIKVGNTGRLCQSLLTTYLPYELYPLLKGWDTIIWLDSDAYDKALKYVAQLGSNGVTARAVYTTKDPKAYNSKQIEEAIINGRLV